MSSKKPELTPEEQKKKLALIYAGTITVIIFGVWILFFIGDAKKELSQTSESRVALFATFENNIGKFADTFVNQFKSLPEKFIGTSTNILIATSTSSSTESTSTTIEVATSTIISTTTNNQ